MFIRQVQRAASCSIRFTKRIGGRYCCGGQRLAWPLGLNCSYVESGSVELLRSAGVGMGLVST
jgi:hypothetical protein